MAMCRGRPFIITTFAAVRFAKYLSMDKHTHKRSITSRKAVSPIQQNARTTDRPEIKLLPELARASRGTLLGGGDCIDMHFGERRSRSSPFVRKEQNKKTSRPGRAGRMPSQHHSCANIAPSNDAAAQRYISAQPTRVCRPHGGTGLSVAFVYGQG